MTKKNNEIISFLDEILPNARCALNYTKDYELVIAVMLSAQTTDIAVNKVTDSLFKRFPTILDFYNADIEEIKTYIKCLGLFDTKAKNIKGIIKIIVEEYDSKVPCDKEKLMKLPGVGNKTSNVVLAELFKVPTFPVDTHVERISKRLGFAGILDSPLQVEKNLNKEFLKEYWIKLHHQFIWFGRTMCLARNPKCENCKLHEYCSYYKSISNK